MGLEERRKIKQLQDDVLPGRLKEIEEICGKSIPYEIDWSSFDGDLEGLNFMDNVSCHRLNMALRTIAVDDMGKEAIRDGLKTIKLKNVPMDQKTLKFDAGVLEMHCAYNMKMDGAFSDSEIYRALIAKL